MQMRISGGAGCAALLALAVAASAQQPPTQPPSASSTASPAQELTVTGCVQREADYRRARDAGGGGAAGTGVGVDNEFVLINASIGSAGLATPTGTSGTAPSSAAYEMTGPNEGKLADHVGKRVEIRGKLKAAETTASGQPTGGATAGKPP